MSCNELHVFFHVACISRAMLQVCLTLLVTFGLMNDGQAQTGLQWRELPALPDELGLAGPIVGVHDNVLIAGGGANFPKPVWQNEKMWHDRMYALPLKTPDSKWQLVNPLPTGALAYSACVSTPIGIVVIGGNDKSSVHRECWLIQCRQSETENAPGDKSIQLNYQRLPDLPEPSVNAQAAYVDSCVVVCGSQSTNELSSASATTWRLKLPHSKDPKDSKDSKGTLSQDMGVWSRGMDCPGGARALAVVASMTIRSKQIVVVAGGRRMENGQVRFLSDCWFYDVGRDSWEAGPALPVPLAAGGGGELAPGKLVIVSGDDGKLFHETDRLRDGHPGFAPRTWMFDAEVQRWTSAGTSPANQVTTIPIVVADSMLLVSGEVRPRVRTNRVWEIRL